MRKLEGVELDQEEEPENGFVFKYILKNHFFFFSSRWIKFY
jgi:hypothetical protein